MGKWYGNSDTFLKCKTYENPLNYLIISELRKASSFSRRHPNYLIFNELLGYVSESDTEIVFHRGTGSGHTRWNTTVYLSVKHIASIFPTRITDKFPLFQKSGAGFTPFHCACYPKSKNYSDKEQDYSNQPGTWLNLRGDMIIGTKASHTIG